jgi:hypothetical protein
MATVLGVSFTTVQRAIQKLLALGIAAPTTAAKRNKIYCASQILAILEEETVIANNLGP